MSRSGDLTHQSACINRSMWYAWAMTVSDQLRRAIEASGESRYAIAQATGVNQSTLSRFMHGGGLTSENLDLIAKHLGMELRVRKKGNK